MTCVALSFSRLISSKSYKISVLLLLTLRGFPPSAVFYPTISPLDFIPLTQHNAPQMVHSPSDELFIYKKLFSDKMVADCVESLIGTYVYVSMNINNTHLLYFF